ncbi:MAG: flagellar basal body rod protein FlgC [Gammaproteobacteria bacterium]|nr:flagellar basal body rod protein FlgC [Gammaproteobacteria bacterium]
MSLFSVFDVAGSAMSAQSLRLNITASNLANADTVSGSAKEAYHARAPIFQAVLNGVKNNPSVSVQMRGVVESQAPVDVRYAPDHPLANDEGNVYASNVNRVEEMANMISSSRSYQNNIDVLDTSKKLLLRTLMLGE